jgi:hypothetical protein
VQDFSPKKSRQCKKMNIAKVMKGTTQMTECKHRWEPSNFGIKYRKPNHYIFECKRCGKSIFATLKESANA